MPSLSTNLTKPTTSTTPRLSKAKRNTNSSSSSSSLTTTHPTTYSIPKSFTSFSPSSWIPKKRKLRTYSSSSSSFSSWSSSLSKNKKQEVTSSPTSSSSISPTFTPTTTPTSIITNSTSSVLLNHLNSQLDSIHLSIQRLYSEYQLVKNEETHLFQFRTSLSNLPLTHSYWTNLKSPSFPYSERNPSFDYYPSHSSDFHFTPPPPPPPSHEDPSDVLLDLPFSSSSSSSSFWDPAISSLQEQEKKKKEKVTHFMDPSWSFFFSNSMDDPTLSFTTPVDLNSIPNSTSLSSSSSSSSSLTSTPSLSTDSLPPNDPFLSSSYHSFLTPTKFNNEPIFTELHPSFPFMYTPLPLPPPLVSFSSSSSSSSSTSSVVSSSDSDSFASSISVPLTQEELELEQFLERF